MTLELAPAGRIVRRRTRRDPRPRYKPNTAHQLDAVLGTPELVVPGDHLARKVREVVGAMDFSALDGRRSSLGRHGHDPRRVVAVLVYASLVGIHEASKIAQAVETDAAFRLLSGGHRLPQGTLRRIRPQLREFFASAVEQTVRMADERGFLKLDEVSVDSVRVRAHASSNSVRTLSRSKQRLTQLQAKKLDGMTEVERTTHDEKLAKHTEAVRRCEAEGRTSISTTNPLAGLLKLPDGGSAPAHRVTVGAVGVKARFILALLVDASGSDHGKVGPSLDAMKRVLERVGIGDQVLGVAYDAGYWSDEDVQAAETRAWADVVIAPGSRGERALFEREHFTTNSDGALVCPAGRVMRGPTKAGTGLRYFGVGCTDCHLRSRCTTAEQRALVLHPALDRARAKVQAPEGQARYRKRIATIEPVFSNIESVMKFRRSATRHPAAVVAEMNLKALAHNVSRLIAARPLSFFLVIIDEFRSTL